MLHNSLAAAIAFATAVAGCASLDPQPGGNQTDRKLIVECAAAMQSNDTRAAESICEHSIAHIDWERVGPRFKAGPLHNLGRIKHALGKHAQAEQLLRASLLIKETYEGPASADVARTLTGLALTFVAQRKMDEGLATAGRLAPLVSLLSERERPVAVDTVRAYAHFAAKTGKTDAAQAMEQSLARQRL